MRRSLMRKLLIVLMLLAFSTAISGCGDMQGPCPHGVCSEEHSKTAGPPAEEKSE